MHPWFHSFCLRHSILGIASCSVLRKFLINQILPLTPCLMLTSREEQDKNSCFGVLSHLNKTHSDLQVAAAIPGNPHAPSWPPPLILFCPQTLLYTPGMSLLLNIITFLPPRKKLTYKLIHMILYFGHCYSPRKDMCTL